MRVGLCLIATGRYGHFLAGILDSAREFFLRHYERRFFVFADQLPPTSPDVDWIRARHTPWPGPTLYRYRMIHAEMPRLAACDYIYYTDVDMRFVAQVDDRILGELVATMHPGFAGRCRATFTYEMRPESRACVHPSEGTCYYAGGFQGGSYRGYLSAVSKMAQAIEDDAQRGITAVWHDESHWNRYLIDHPPSVVLPPTYCCPESWPMAGRCLLALDKDHAQLRG